MMMAGQVAEARRPSQAVRATKQRAEEQGHESSCGRLSPLHHPAPFTSLFL